MTRLMKVALTFVACAILATPTVASAQTPSAPPALERVPAPAPIPASVGVRIPPNYEWKGFYAGGSFGYGGSLSDTSFTFLPDTATFGAMPTTLNPAPMGWTYGFHGGYNIILNNWIYGFEGDYLWSSIQGDTSLNPILLDDGTEFNGTYLVDQEVNWLASARGRFGMKVKSKYYVFATGGISWGGINSFAEADYNPEGSIRYPGGLDSTRTGWTIGGGVECPIKENLSLRAQYLYYGFPEKEATADPVPTHPPFQVQYGFKNATNSFTFGVNYKF